MKIHLQSDTHIEMGYIPKPSVTADVFVCAGDIGTLDTPKNCYRLKKYFLGLKKNCDHVIWVLGNHEFYNSTYEDTLERAKRLADQVGIHLLDIVYSPTVTIDGVKFWGTTFWTDLNNHDWFAHKAAQEGLNDFVVIKHREGVRTGFTAHETYEINQRSRKAIDWDADVIITHHNPIDIEHSRFPRESITYAFNNTRLEEQIMDSNVKYWLYGHTHDSRVTELNKTLVVSNQVGYQMKQSGWFEDCGFDPSLVLEI